MPRRSVDPDLGEGSTREIPRTLLSGGRFSVVGGGTYKLSMARSQWTLVDVSGGEICRIILRDRHYRTKEQGAYFAFGEHAADQPVLVLAVSVAVLLHDLQARSPGVGNI
jgi:hypothetical protein